MTIAELQTIAGSGESYTIEFKRNVNSDISKELVAFANGSGGRIFVGIEDSGEITGIKIDNGLRSKVQSMADACDPAVDINLEVFQNVFIVSVKEGSDKPYRCTSGFYLRSGANSQKLRTAQIREFLQNEGKVRYDELLQPNIEFDSQLSVRRFSRFMQITQLPRLMNDIPLLENLKAIVVGDNGPVWTNAGLLFFGAQPHLVMPHSIVTCVLYKGTEKLTILDRKDLTEDIITNIEDALTFLKKHLNLSYKIEGTRRKEVLELPETALREAVVNAVCHRDYFEKGATVTIEIFDDRVEISNPGGLPKGLTPADLGTKSLARNPVIAEMLMRARLVEKLGTGITRIQMALRAANHPIADFSYTGFFTVFFKRLQNNDAVYFTRYQVLEKNDVVNDVVNDAVNDAVNKLLIASFNVSISESMRKRLTNEIVALIAQDGITRAQIMHDFAVGQATAQRDLKLLKDANLIVFEGAPKTGLYLLSAHAKKTLFPE